MLQSLNIMIVGRNIWDAEDNKSGSGTTIVLNEEHI